MQRSPFLMTQGSFIQPNFSKYDTMIDLMRGTPQTNPPVQLVYASNQDLLLMEMKQATREYYRARLAQKQIADQNLQMYQSTVYDPVKEEARIEAQLQRIEQLKAEEDAFRKNKANQASVGRRRAKLYRYENSRHVQFNLDHQGHNKPL